LPGTHLELLCSDDVKHGSITRDMTLIRRYSDGADAAPIPQDCQRVSEVLALIGDKWRVLVVMRLSDGPRRFKALRQTIGGISQRMLTMTLRGLERDGLVKSTVSKAPVRVEYELTPVGYALREPLWWRSASGRRPPACI
jgi:DNA-binding HxlR family transcriptional regulator